MNGNQLRSFVNQFRQLLVEKHRSDYRMGYAFHMIREERLWETWPRDDRREPGYDNFGEFCDRECGVSLSQANQKAHNYEVLCGIGLDESSDTFARCMRLGWSKLNVLLRVARDENALLQWLNVIEGRNLTELQLRAMVDDARAHHEGRLNTPGDEGADETDEDEATTPAPRGRPGTTAGYARYEVMFESQQERDSFTQAVDLIRRRYGDVGVGRAIAMMAIQYLATVPRTAQGGAVMEVENLIRMFETGYGLQLQVIVPEPRRRKKSKSLRSMRDGGSR